MLLRFAFSGLAALVLTISPASQAASAMQGKPVTNQAYFDTRSQEVMQLYRTGDYSGALGLARTVLAEAERAFGSDDLITLRALNDVASLSTEVGLYDDAEPLLERLLSATTRIQGPDHHNTLVVAQNYANLLRRQGDFARAEPLFIRVLEGFDTQFGPNDPNTMLAMKLLGSMYIEAGQFDQAEPILVEVLDRRTRVLRPNHPDIFISQTDLAHLYNQTGRTTDAVPLIAEALEGFEQVLGPLHPDTLAAVNNLASVYFRIGAFEEAEPLFVRGIAGFEEVLGPYHPNTLRLHSNLGVIYSASGRLAEAEHHLAHALDGLEAAVGQNHPLTLSAMSNLGRLYHDGGIPHEAAQLYLTSLERRAEALGPDHPDTLLSIGLLARLRSDFETGSPVPESLLGLVEQGLTRSAIHWREVSLDIEALDNPVSQAANTALLVQAYRDLLQSGDVSARDEALLDRAFSAAQAFVFSSAADALRASTAALTVDDPQARALLEAVNDATGSFEAAQARLAALLQRPAEQQDRRLVDAARSRVAAGLERVRAANAALAESDVALADLTVARTADVSEVQSVLTPGEALIFYSASRQGALTAFVVRPGSAAVVPIATHPVELANSVETLRQGLTLDAGQDYQLSTADLSDQPFDLEAAKALHDAIFEPLRPHLEGAQRVLVVADGPLQTLPLHVLVKELPDEGAQGFARYRGAAWLSEEFAFSRLPAVSSLLALRREETPAPGGRRTMLGIGDPVLRDYEMSAAVESGPNPGSVFLQFANASGATSVADLPSLRQTSALLTEMASSLELEASDLLLGPDALESRLVALNEAGTLSDYRAVTFATHALINDEIEGLDEPAIVLTPTPDSDGLLRASDVVQFDLDAGLVILAACNTAAADGSPGAEALSGLAKAFFYAGARSLLVSNWPAEAGATAELIPDLVAGVETDGLSRAEALQRAMNALRDTHPFDFYAHPALWAPYMVVADG